MDCGKDYDLRRRTFYSSLLGRLRADRQPLVGGALAVIEPSINTVVFYFHEKIWQRVEARRGLARGQWRRNGWLNKGVA